MTNRFKAISRLAQKAGLRYKMDVIPLNAELVPRQPRTAESARRATDCRTGELPSDMKEFHAYCRAYIEFITIGVSTPDRVSLDFPA